MKKNIIKDLLKELKDLYDESDFIEEEFKNMTSEEFDEYIIEQYENDNDFENFTEYVQWSIDNFGTWG